MSTMSRQSGRTDAAADGHAVELRPDWIPTRVDIVCWFAGTLAGVAAALYSVAFFSSWWLAFFVFAVVSHTLGHGLPDVITKPYRLSRTIYVTLFPVLGSTILYIAYDLLGTMWLAVVLGLVLGTLFQVGLGSALLPESMELTVPLSGKETGTRLHGSSYTRRQRIE